MARTRKPMEESQEEPNHDHFRHDEDQPQPGLRRKVLKLRPETQELLTQVAAFRGEKMIDCVHNLLVEEVRRNAEQMKRRVDELIALAQPAPKSALDDNDE